MYSFKLRIAVCEESFCLKFIVKVELHNKTSDGNEKNTTSLTREMSPLGKRADVLIKSLKKKAQVNFPHKKTNYKLCTEPEAEKQVERYTISKIISIILYEFTLFMKNIYKLSAYVGNIWLCALLWAADE